MEKIIENDDNEILDDYKRFIECGFSSENSCYAYTEDFLLNYINNKHPINLSDIEIKEILSFIIMTEQPDFNKLSLKSTITKSIIGSKKLKKKKSIKKSKKKSIKKSKKRSKKRS